jgi:hypothetical protein
MVHSVRPELAEGYKGISKNTKTPFSLWDAYIHVGIPDSIGIYITFQYNKNNGLLNHQAPSPAGEGWGEENKINCLYPPHPDLLPPREKG